MGIELTTSRLRQHRRLPVVQQVRFMSLKLCQKHNPNDMPEAALDNWQSIWNAQVSISTLRCVLILNCALVLAIYMVHFPSFVNIGLVEVAKILLQRRQAAIYLTRSVAWLMILRHIKVEPQRLKILTCVIFRYHHHHHQNDENSGKETKPTYGTTF